jgi:hypothetical protein
MLSKAFERRVSLTEYSGLKANLISQVSFHPNGYRIKLTIHFGFAMI